jgi:hypothetical protein
MFGKLSKIINKTVILSQNLIMQKQVNIIPTENHEKFNDKMEKLRIKSQKLLQQKELEEELLYIKE